jgi:hypothetical protein
LKATKDQRVAARKGFAMTALLVIAGLALLLVGPLFAPSVGLHPAIPAFVGLACGLVAVMRGARPLPDAGDAASPGAAADARLLGNHRIDAGPGNGIGITDVGGAP